MVAHLSDEWLSELDRLAQADDRLRQATAGVRLVLEQVVTPTDDLAGGSRPAEGSGLPEMSEAVVWQVVVDDGDVRFHRGRVASATVRFTTDRATARSIASGTTTTQQAFMSGRLRVGGDTTAIVEHHDVLAGLGDVFAAVTLDD